jgi:aspartyl-tRNA synthetase
VLAKAVYPLPIDPIGRLESNIDNRLNARALDMRNQKTASIFKLRHHVLASIRKTLTEKKFIEINTPKIIGSASEGGANLFSLEYFGKQAYLAQSPQLYKEQMTIGLERVYEIASFYRAEKSHTGRHLSEFTSVDIEAAFMDYTDVMEVLESLVVEVYKYVAEKCKKEQKAIGIEIKVPSSPFERITYSQVLEELKSAGEDLKFGDDLLDSHLRIIGKNHPGFFFLIEWPMKLKPFYIREKDDDPKISRSFDLQFGYLELASGGTRLHDPKKIRTRLEEQGLDPSKFSNHLQAFDWGMPPHAGWGLGLERFLTTLIGIDNVREVVLYPRDPDRLTP